MRVCCNRNLTPKLSWKSSTTHKRDPSNSPLTHCSSFKAQALLFSLLPLTAGEREADQKRQHRECEHPPRVPGSVGSLPGQEHSVGGLWDPSPVPLCRLRHLEDHQHEAQLHPPVSAVLYLPASNTSVRVCVR